jgi:thymidylate kinase
MAKDLDQRAEMAGAGASRPGPRGVTAGSGLESRRGDGYRRADLGGIPKGLFVAVEGIDGAGKTTAAQVAADVLRGRGRRATAIARGDVAQCSAYVADHMTALRDLIWGEPPDAPYLDLGDEHWVHLQAAWYAAFARCVVEPAVAEGAIVLADTWGYKFLAKLALRPPARASFDAAWNVFLRILRPDVVVHLHADPATAAARKSAFSGSETGNREGTPELSAAAFTDYQRNLAGVLESFAGKGGWVCVDASFLDVAEAGSAVADIAEHHLRVTAAGTGSADGGGDR